MEESDSASAAASPTNETHSLPVFQRRRSRTHRRVAFEELHKRAQAELDRETDFSQIHTLVQFAGFPRSGHSIVGSLIDAHADAVVSHEMDMLGLVEAGFSMEEIYALIGENSAAFESNGRFWNGHCYQVPGAAGGRATAPLVVGDKKGDWAIRRLADDPTILTRFGDAFPGVRTAWICIVRNPFDNVATLSLRRSCRYDELRISANSHADFKRRMIEERGSKASGVLPAMLDDYAGLCAGVEAVRALVNPQDWLEVRHEDFVAAPSDTLRRIFGFLGLAEDAAAVAGAEQIVRESPNRSRDDIDWTRNDIDHVQALVDRHEFLHGYAFDEPDVSDDQTAQRPSVSRSSHGRANTLAVKLFSCVGLRYDAALIAPFVEHYVGLGLDPASIHMILNLPEQDDDALDAARRTLDELGVSTPSVWIGPYTSGEMWERRRALQVALSGPSEFVISADVDEFHVYPAPLEEMIEWMRSSDIELLDGPMIDRVAADGGLPPIASGMSLFEQFPVEADVMCPIGKQHGAKDATGTVKMMLFRGSIAPGLGGHGPVSKRVRFAYGVSLAALPRIKTSEFRFSLPARVLHFKWHSGLVASVEGRLQTPGASPAGSKYGRRVLDHLNAHGGALDLSAILVRNNGPAANATDWAATVAEQRVASRALRTARTNARRTVAPRGFGDWRVRQLTGGTQDQRFHSHSYYDIPVFNEAKRQIVGFESNFAERWMTTDDIVIVGLIDIDRGGFRPIGRSSAWSWQQGPMAQWHPADRSIVYNDREDNRFVARVHDIDTGVERLLPRPVYAIDPAGAFALGVNMARLDEARPGYGYVGGEGARMDEAAPEDDGIWRIDLGTGRERLILSLDRARDSLLAYLDPAERSEHLQKPMIYWFNHVKLSPNGRRFTAKLRWRVQGKPKWNGTMGVSITCGSDGSALAILARGTSHVMWLDDSRLYFWHQSFDRLALYEDQVPVGKPLRVILPETITSNVHIRHVPTSPGRWILDKPYQEEVSIAGLDPLSGALSDIASFSNHVPKHGPFRCDLYPVPAVDGRRVIVNSLHDGGRQLYVAEHDSLTS